jgi:hypothetical protein
VGFGQRDLSRYLVQRARNESIRGRYRTTRKSKQRAQFTIFGRRSVRLIHLSVDHRVYLGAEGIQRERFTQHVHACIKEIASDRSVLSVA